MTFAAASRARASKVLRIVKDRKQRKKPRKFALKGTLVQWNESEKEKEDEKANAAKLDAQMKGID